MSQRTRRPPKQTFAKKRPEERSPVAPLRLFLAVPLPPDVIALVDRTISDLEKEGWPVRWTAPGNAHITLHFLGQVEAERAQILRLALPEIVARHESFGLRTADLGVFPKLKRPRVIWLGLYGPAHRLHTLRDAIGATLAEYEFALEEREFHPHVTLGRVRSTRNTRIRDLPEAIRARFERAVASGAVTHRNPLPIPVTEVQLVRSHLERDGARYEVIERFPLAPAADSDRAPRLTAPEPQRALITLHLTVIANGGTGERENRRLVRTGRLPTVPEPGATIAVGPRGESFRVDRVVARENDVGIDCYLNDDQLPDNTVLDERVGALEADGWTRDLAAPSGTSR
jgi:2'-5' RNA ligase